MFKILTKKCSFEHWNRSGVANWSIALVDCPWFCFGL